MNFRLIFFSWFADISYERILYIKVFTVGLLDSLTGKDGQTNVNSSEFKSIIIDTTNIIKELKEVLKAGKPICIGVAYNDEDEETQDFIELDLSKNQVYLIEGINPNSDSYDLQDDGEILSLPRLKEIINTINKEPIQTKPQSNSNLPLDKIKQIFDNHDTEWVSVASLGSQWKLLQVDFDPRTYGFKKLGDLVKAYPKVFDVEERSTSTNEHKNLYVRLKK